MATAVNFFQPGTDAAVDANQIQRQRDLAALLMKQGQTPSQGQMVSGHYVAPSPLSYLAQIGNAAAGAFTNNNADTREKQLVQKLRDTRVKETNDFMTAVNGSPAKDVPLNVPNDDEGNPLPPASTPAVAPDRTKAMAIALQSQNPMLQSAGGDMMKNQMLASQIGEALGVPAGGAVGGSPPAPGAAPAGAPGGLLGGLSPQVVKLAMAGPVGEKLAGMVQDANKPIPLREGDLVRQDAQGNYVSAYQSPKLDPGIVPTRNAQGQVTSASMIPGYDTSVGQISGAKANAQQQAEAGNQTVTIDFGPGIGTKTLLRSQLNGMLQGQGAPAPGAPAAQPSPVAPPPRPMPTALPPGPLTMNSQVPAQPDLRGNFSGTPDQQMAAINGIPNPQQRAQALAALQNQNRGVNPAFNPQGGDPSIPTSIPVQPGGQSMPAPQMAAPAPMGASAMPGISVQDDSQKAYGTARAKDYATQASTVQQTGRAASSTIANLNQLEQLYKDPNVAKGALAENISGMKNVAASLGVDVKGLPAEQAVQSLTNQMALNLRSTGDGGGMPGSLSDSDRNFLKSMTPGLTSTPEGRSLVMNTSRQIAQRQIQAAQMASQYEQAHGQLDPGFDQQLSAYSAANPLFANQKAPVAPSGFKIIKVH